MTKKLCFLAFTLPAKRKKRKSICYFVIKICNCKCHTQNIQRRACTNNEWTIEIQSAEMLIGRLIKCDGSLLVNTQHCLLPISLDMHQVPEIVIEWV